MPTTVNQILAKPGARLEYWLELEGIPIIFTTTSDTAGLATALAAHPMNSDGKMQIFPCLNLPGPITRALDLFSHSTNPATMSFTLVESSMPGAGKKNILPQIFSHDDGLPYVTNSVGCTDSVVDVNSTGFFGLGSSGQFYLGHERFDFTGALAGALPISARGKYPANGKSSWSRFVGLTNFIGPRLAVAPADFSSIVSACGPRVWKGKHCRVGVTAIDPGTNTFVPYAQCTILFAGMLSDNPSWTRDGLWHLEAESIEGGLKQTILRDQFTGFMSGYTLDSTIIYVSENGAATPASFTLAASAYTLDSLLAALNKGLGDLFTAGTLTYSWSFSLKTEGTHQRVHLSIYNATVTGGTGYNQIWLDEGDRTPWIFFLLGMENFGGLNSQSVGPIASHATREATGTGQAPVTTYWDPSSPYAAHPLALQSVQGSFFVQPANTLPAAVATANVGLVTIGNSRTRWPVTFDGGVSLTYSGHGAFEPDGTPHNAAPSDAVVLRLGDPAQQIPVKQVLHIANGMRASQVLLTLMLSTGTANYNYDGSGTNYDQFPYQIGCAIPSTLVDVSSFVSVDSLCGSLASGLTLNIEQPTPAKDIIEPILAGLGIWLAWSGTLGKLALVHPTHPSGMTPKWALTDDNTGSTAFCDVDGCGDLVRNHLSLRYNVDAQGAFQDSIDFNDVASESEQGKADGIQYDCPWLHDADGTAVAAWIKLVAEPMCKFFASGNLYRYKRSGNQTLIGLSAGDIATLQASDAPDMIGTVAGTYGVSGLSCWVASSTFDPRTNEFTEIVPLALGGNVVAIAPAAMLDYSRGDFGYFVTGLPSYQVYLRDHEFSLSTESKDVTRFAVGDKIRVIEADPANPAAPVFTDVTVLVVNTDNLRISGPLTAVPDAHKRWYVIPQHYASQTAGTQRGLTAAMCDATSELIQSTGDLGVWWGTHALAADGNIPATGVRYRRPYNVEVDDGAPLTPALMRDAALNLDNLYAYVTAPQVVNQVFIANRTTAIGGDLLAGPYVVYMPVGCSQLMVEFWAALAAGSDFMLVDTFTTPNLLAVTDKTIDAVPITGAALARYTKTITPVLTSERLTYLALYSNSGATTTSLRSVNAWAVPRSF